jgi:hypothetical protein
MLYWLVTAMYPQFLITLDEEDEEKAVTVRVGQAVNTVGLAGTRSGISGVSLVSSVFGSLISYLSSSSQCLDASFHTNSVVENHADLFSSRPTRPPSESLLVIGPNWAPMSSSLTHLFLRAWSF